MSDRCHPYTSIYDNDFFNITGVPEISYDEAAIVIASSNNTISDNTIENVGIAFAFLPSNDPNYNVVENKWYKDLHNHLNGKQLSYNYNWFLFILKFIKNFSLSFFDLIFYKIYNLFFNSYFKKKKSNKINCFHSFGYNFKSLNHKDYIDRLYGKTTYKYARKNFYLITETRKNLIALRKKKNIDYVISNSYLRFSDFFKIYIIIMRLNNWKVIWSDDRTKYYPNTIKNNQN